MAQQHPKTFHKNVTALEILEGTELDGKYCLVTGANCGIGFETARALALKNAHVTITCRNTAKGNKVMEKILKEKRDAKIKVLELECSNLSSVEFCAKKYLERGWPLHILILNAGIYNPVHRITDEGFEATFQINYLSQFYLTQLLQQKLIESAPARVVVVSSDAYKQFHWTPSDITWEKVSPTHKHKINSAFEAYGISKFCQVLFAMELSARLFSQGVTAYSLHPGTVQTRITRNSGAYKIFFKIARPLSITPAKGAATVVYCAAFPGLEESGHAGSYFVGCRHKGASASAQNRASAENLWNVTEEMIEHYLEGVTKEMKDKLEQWEVV